MKKTYFLFLLFSFSLSAQIKGVVKDSISGKPVSFANIWIENENNGTTSEENGEFNISISEKSKNFIVSAIGYKRKTIKISEAEQIFLSPSDVQIKEVIISNRKNTKEIEIGKTKSLISQAFENGPKIDAKYFPYLTSYKKTKYLKKIILNTDNRKEEATIRIHLYSVGIDGFPDKELLNKDLIITVKNGVRNNKIDISSFDIKMPINGVFVGFEKLMIESNKLEKSSFDTNSQTTKIHKTYCPYILYNNVERDTKFIFQGGKWIKKTTDSSLKTTIDEPSINLILTN